MMPALRLSPEQESILRRSRNSAMADHIWHSTNMVVNDRCQSLADAYHQVIGVRNRRGIVTRVARAAAFRMANEGMPFSVLPEGKDEAEMLSHVHEHVTDEFDRWWLQKNTFIPASRMDAEAEFLETHGPINWANFSAKEGKEHDIYDVSNLKSLSYKDEVARCVAYIETQGNIDVLLHSHFDDVRTAVYDVINGRNIEELLPEIERVYESALLQPETIMKLESNEPNDRQKFLQKTRKGVFVYGFHESAGGKPSVRDQLLENFQREYKWDEPRYEGRYLMDDRRQMLGYLTYWQPPERPSRKNGSMIREYLRHGVTGIATMYSRSTPRSTMEKTADRTLMIDTIRGAVPLAAARIMAKATLEMAAKSSYVETFMGYRLQELVFNPPLMDAYRREIRLCDNLSSSQFFSRLGCTHFAEDFNRRGDRSRRELPDGRVVELNPEWVAFAGNMDQVVDNATQYWRAALRDFGDTGDDGVVTHDRSHWLKRRR